MFYSQDHEIRNSNTALNEEQSIKNIIQRCLEARKSIIAETNLKEIGITVVSDGSTDNTVKFANEFKNDVHIIVFEENKGYELQLKRDGDRVTQNFCHF